MSEIFNIRNGYTPSKENMDYWENGNIPWFRMDDIRNNGKILSDSIQHITDKGIRGELFEENSIIVATTATIGEHALILKKYLANQRFTNLSIKSQYKNLVNIKYLFYYMFIVDEWCKNNINKSGFASVDMIGFKNLSIPIPPLREQQRIVDILDRFDALVNDITKGLPAEINARRKQYEYYREKLLTF